MPRDASKTRVRIIEAANKLFYTDGIRATGVEAQEFQSAGLSEGEALARQIVLLIDGAFSAMLVHHDSDYIRQAGQAAHDMLAQRERNTG